MVLQETNFKIFSLVYDENNLILFYSLLKFYIISPLSMFIYLYPYRHLVLRLCLEAGDFKLYAVTSHQVYPVCGYH